MSPVNVGARLRQLRLDVGMSVRTLATQTGVSPSLISQVEHSHVRPSIGSLERLALALGVSLGAFFTAVAPSTVRVVRANAREKRTSTWSPVSIEALAPLDGTGLWEPVMLTMAPGGSAGTIPQCLGARRLPSCVSGRSR